MSVLHRGSRLAVLAGIAGLMAMPGQAMAGDQGGVTLTPAQRAKLGNAQAADMPMAYTKAPIPVRIYSWTGFYGGLFGGGAYSGNRDYNIVADPAAGQTVVVGPAANGSAPIFSQAYNNLATNGTGQVTNTIIPGGVNCAGFVNCDVGGAAITSITPNTNPGFRTDAMLPTSQNASQLAGLFGVELGYRKQFDNNFVLGIGADIMGFSHGGTSTFSSNGSFLNSNGFTANSQAVGCIDGVLPFNTCQQAQLLNASGSVGTVNSGGSTSTLQIGANPNWLGTVRASAGYAFDRVLIFGSAGLAYSDAGMHVSGSYRDTVTSACSGVSNVVVAAGNNNGGAQPGQAFGGYQCGAATVNSASVSQITSTSITYSGNRGGGVLTGFAAGAGAAYAVTDHVSLVFEGMYYNLGTERVTVTGSGTTTQTTTVTNAIGTSNGGVTTGGGTTQTIVTLPATASSFTVSKMIDGAIFKGGIQFKF
jgi:opacity protein-like surface antigen